MLKDQSICITGGAGIIGSRLASRLLKCNAKKVVAIGRRQLSNNNPLHHHHNYKYISANILDAKAMKRALEGSTAVIHLASLKNAAHSKNEPLEYFKTNSFGTASILDVCRSLKIKKIIYVSTSHVYGIPDQLPVDEKQSTSPISIYASSKLSGELKVQSYAANFGLSCDIVRPANIYGTANSETVIGRAINQVINGEAIHLRNLKAVRDFVHVDDIAEALIRILNTSKKESECRIINVSSGKGESVRKIASILSQLAIDNKLGIIKIQEDNIPEQIMTFYMENKYLKELTGWSPQINLGKGLSFAFQEFLQNKLEEK